jgi:hypothetical protein
LTEPRPKEAVKRPNKREQASIAGRRQNLLIELAAPTPPPAYPPNHKAHSRARNPPAGRCSERSRSHRPQCAAWMCAAYQLSWFDAHLWSYAEHYAALARLPRPKPHPSQPGSQTSEKYLLHKLNNLQPARTGNRSTVCDDPERSERRPSSSGARSIFLSETLMPSERRPFRNGGRFSACPSPLRSVRKWDSVRFAESGSAHNSPNPKRLPGTLTRIVSHDKVSVSH